MRTTPEDIVDHARSAMAQESPEQIEALLVAADEARLAVKVERIVVACRQLGEAAAAALTEAQGRINAVMMPWLVGQQRKTDPAFDLMLRRQERGGMFDDAAVWPDMWQSTVCAAMLCSITPCPSDEHGLSCTCRCHR